MNIRVQITQITNGYILYLYDADSSVKHVDLFIETLNEVIEKIKTWTKEA